MKQIKIRKGLFLLHEGIGSTIFSSQVIEHVKDMNDNNIHMDILSYDLLSKTWETSNQNLLKARKVINNKIILKKGINLFIPLLNLVNVLSFMRFIYKNQNEYDFIHARADYSAFVAILTKVIHRKPVIWDCRGDLLNEIQNTLRTKNLIIKSLGKLFIIPQILLRQKINQRFSDYQIFVSEALYNFNKDKLKINRSIIVPCLVSEKVFFFDNELRKQTRERLNYTLNDVVFMYSGSMIGYQFIDGLKLLFEDIMKLNNSKILILTSETEKAKRFFNFIDERRLIIMSSDFEQMNSYYNASDFGILIREKLKLNFVASPTKFGEYCLTGLPVIQNDAIDQTMNFALKIGNYVCVNNLSVEPKKVDERLIISDKSKNYYSRNVMRVNYLKLYNQIDNKDNLTKINFK